MTRKHGAAKVMEQPLKNTPYTEKLTGPLAWRADDLADGAWLFSLDGDCLGELDRVLAHLRRHPLMTVLLDPADFDMPECQRVMGNVRQALDGGCGFALVDRMPVDDMSKEEAKALYWILSSMVSRPVAQKLDGTMLYDVHDTGAQAAPGSGIRPDKTNIDLTFHNDNAYNNPMPDYVGLLCLKPAKSGGLSRVMSFETAYNALLDRHPAAIERLYAPFPFDRQKEFFPGDPETISAPIFENGPGLNARLGLHQIRNGYAMTEARMDDEAAKAIAALEDVFSDIALQFTFMMEAGQFQFVNNKVIGHSRTRFEDFETEEERRHLVRIWMRDGGDRSYPG